MARPQRRNFMAVPQDPPMDADEPFEVAEPSQPRQVRDVRLRPSQTQQRAPAHYQYAEFTQAQFVDALKQAHAVLGTWFEVACTIRTQFGHHMTEAKMLRWSQGKGPTQKTMAAVYPILVQIAGGGAPRSQRQVQITQR